MTSSRQAADIAETFADALMKKIPDAMGVFVLVAVPGSQAGTFRSATAVLGRGVTPFAMWRAAHDVAHEAMADLAKAKPDVVTH